MSCPPAPKKLKSAEGHVLIDRPPVMDLTQDPFVAQADTVPVRHPTMYELRSRTPFKYCRDVRRVVDIYGTPKRPRVLGQGMVLVFT